MVNLGLQGHWSQAEVGARGGETETDGQRSAAALPSGPLHSRGVALSLELGEESMSELWIYSSSGPLRGTVSLPWPCPGVGKFCFCKTRVRVLDECVTWSPRLSLRPPLFPLLLPPPLCNCLCLMLPLEASTHRIFLDCPLHFFFSFFNYLLI